MRHTYIEILVICYLSEIQVELGSLYFIWQFYPYFGESWEGRGWQVWKIKLGPYCGKL